MLATRAWELLAGGVCAFFNAQRFTVIPQRISHQLSGLGFFLSSVVSEYLTMGLTFQG